MSSASDSMSGKTLFIYSFILVIIWGGAYTLVGVGVRYMSPIWLVALRLAFGAIFLTAYMYAQGKRFPPLNDSRWLWYIFLGFTGMTAPFYLLSTGQVKIDSGLTAILVGSMPLLTIILAHFFTDEKLNWRKFIGFLIGFLGIVVLFLPNDFSLALVADWQSQLLILGAAGFYAITTVAAKRAPKTSSTVGATMMLITAAIIGVVSASFTGVEGAIPPEGKTAIVAFVIAGLGLGSTAIATIMYLHVIDKTGPSVMAKINYFVPVASVAFGVWFLQEPLSLRMFIAFGIILLGVALSRAKQTKA